MSKLHSIIYKDKKKHRQEKFQLYKQTEKLNTELERIEYTNQSAIDNASSELKNAVKVATIKERTHYVKQHEKVNSNLKRKYIEQQTKVATLTDRVITSERSSTNSFKVSQSQQSNTINMREKLELEMNRNELLRDRIIDLEDTVDDGRKMLQQSMAAIPITIITKEREGRRGRPQWQLYIYELIMEQLVNGTPPSSVNGNIVAHVKAFSPTTIVKELPSIWTIRRTRTILLIVVQTLAAYRLGRSKKWKQLFTDGTSRQQTAYTNLAISIEEDDEEMLTPLLLSSSIYATDETAETVVLAIENTVKEKGELLDKWIGMHCTLFGEDYPHSIPPGTSLHLSKLATGGVITTDTCNTARKISRLLCDVIKQYAIAQMEATLTEGEVVDESQLVVMRVDCHHHLRNIWIGAIVK